MEKNDKRLEHFTKEDIQIASKYMKRGLASLIMKKTQKQLKNLIT